MWVAIILILFLCEVCSSPPLASFFSFVIYECADLRICYFIEKKPTSELLVDERNHSQLLCNGLCFPPDTADIYDNIFVAIKWNGILFDYNHVVILHAKTDWNGSIKRIDKLVSIKMAGVPNWFSVSKCVENSDKISINVNLHVVEKLRISKVYKVGKY